MLTIGSLRFNVGPDYTEDLRARQRFIGPAGGG
jgi:hypothetical protein